MSTSEPKHTQGHSTNITDTKENEYMCPECGKTFDTKEVAEQHLHSRHTEHLRLMHGEYHAKDISDQHKS